MSRGACDGGGQGPLIAAVAGKSPERVLSWSDPQAFTLRHEHKVESTSDYKVDARDWPLGRPVPHV